MAKIDEQHTKDKFFLAAQVKEVSAENNVLKNRVAELEAPPPNEAWKAVLRHAYEAADTEGARLIDDITGHYNAMKSERDALKAQVEKLRAFAWEISVSPFTVNAELHAVIGMLQQYDLYDDTCTPTPLLTGEGEPR